MAEKETIILDFQVEQGSAIQELEKTKKIIVGLQQEQKELNAAYKAGNITLDEYVTEQVRLEAILKKQQAAYTNTQKSVTGVKSKMDDLVKSNQQLNSRLEEGLNNATIFGTNLGGLKNAVTALTNPVTLSVTAIGALASVYARSTTGAKDLEFASNQLGAAVNLLSNDFAKLISATEDGEGIVSKSTNFLIEAVGNYIARGFGSKLADESKELALIAEELEDLGREEVRIRSNNNERLADNQELMTKIQDSQTDINEKQHLAGEIIDNIRKNEIDLVGVKEKQLKLIQDQLNKDQENEKLIELRDAKEAEINVIKRDTTRRIEAINRLESNLLDTENKKTDALVKQNTERKKAQDFAQSEIDRNARIARLEREQEGRPLGGSEDPFGVQAAMDQEFKLDNERVQRFKDNTKKQEDELKKRSDAYKEYVDNQVQLTEDNFNTLAQLFSQGSDARRLFGLAAIGVDTAQAIAALTAASEANPANAFTFGGAGIAQYAAGIIRILANIAAAKQFIGGEFAGGTGGKDFVTTKPTLLLVGDNPGNRERVSVEPLSGRGKTRVHKNSGLIAMAGGGSLTFDGAKEAAVNSVQQTLQLRNSIKNMPTPVVSWVEGERVGKRVRFIENFSKR